MAKLTREFAGMEFSRVRITETDGTIRTGEITVFSPDFENEDGLNGICFRDDNGFGLYLTESDIEDIESI